MDFEHVFQQAGFFSAFQMIIFGSLIAPGIMGRSDLYRLFAGRAAALVVTYGPFSILLYVLYVVAHLC
jgi:hypothetical protein